MHTALCYQVLPAVLAGRTNRIRRVLSAARCAPGIQPRAGVGDPLLAPQTRCLGVKPGLPGRATFAPEPDSSPRRRSKGQLCVEHACPAMAWATFHRVQPEYIRITPPVLDSSKIASPGSGHPATTPSFTQRPSDRPSKTAHRAVALAVRACIACRVTSDEAPERRNGCSYRLRWWLRCSRVASRWQRPVSPASSSG
jgi:hypothetical protein